MTAESETPHPEDRAAEADSPGERLERQEAIADGPYEGLINSSGPRSDAGDSTLTHTMTMMGRYTKGPLPDPETLRAYKDIDPSIVDEILDGFRSERHHRHTMDTELVGLEKQDQVHRAKAVQRGQWMGFAIALAVLLASVALALAGHPSVAIVLAGLDLVGLVAIFLAVKLPQRGTSEGNRGESTPDGTELDAHS